MRGIWLIQCCFNRQKWDVKHNCNEDDTKLTHLSVTGTCLLLMWRSGVRRCFFFFFFFFFNSTFESQARTTRFRSNGREVSSSPVSSTLTEAKFCWLFSFKIAEEKGGKRSYPPTKTNSISGLRTLYSVLFFYSSLCDTHRQSFHLLNIARSEWVRVAASMQSAVVGGAHVTAARRVQGHSGWQSAGLFPTSYYYFLKLCLYNLKYICFFLWF